MSAYCNINGKIQASSEAKLAIDNRAFRYGDGFFETMRIQNGKIRLAARHLDRFFTTAQLLGYELPKLLTADRLQKEVLELLARHKMTDAARLRLSAWRGNGGLFDSTQQLNYLMECWPLDPDSMGWNENGLTLGIYTEAQKAPDRFANCKTANFLAYSLAARFANMQKWNDAVLLNTRNEVCDTCIANIFWIKQGQIYTPPLTDGPVAGVFRAQLLDDLTVIEKTTSPNDLLEADELFLTNAIRGIRWVKNLGDKTYTSTISAEINRKLSQTF